jgi:hypothetical protein
VVSVPARADEIDDYLNRVMESQHIPAVSLAVIKDWAVIKAQGYGLANMEHNIPAQPDTVVKDAAGNKAAHTPKTQATAAPSADPASRLRL